LPDRKPPRKRDGQADRPRQHRSLSERGEEHRPQLAKSSVNHQALVAEEDLLAHDLEQLQFAEDRTANSRYHVNNPSSCATLMPMVRRIACGQKSCW